MPSGDLPLALQQAVKDVEHVHQLRVATRRARAALDIFADCLPDGAFTAAKKQLRKIRRAAGAFHGGSCAAAERCARRNRCHRNALGKALLFLFTSWRGFRRWNNLRLVWAFHRFV